MEAKTYRPIRCWTAFAPLHRFGLRRRRSGEQATDGVSPVSVERGLTELRKLGIEDQLWESSRKEIAPEFPHWKIGADIKAETAAL